MSTLACAAAALAPGDAAPPTVACDAAVTAAAIAPSAPFQIVITASIPPGWYTYWMDPGDAGTAADLHLTLPKGFSAGPLRYPRPHAVVGPGGVTNALDGNVTLAVTITPPAILSQSNVLVGVDLVLLVCKEACFPIRLRRTLDVPVVSSSQPPPSAAPPRTQDRTPPKVRRAIEQAAALPRSIRLRPGTSVRVSNDVITIEGTADPAGEAHFLPARWPGVIWGEAIHATTAGGFQLRIPIAYDHADGLGKPPRLQGLLLFGRGPSDPAWMLDRPGPWTGESRSQEDQP